MAALNSTEVNALAAGNQPYGPFYGGKIHVMRDTLPVLAGAAVDTCDLLPVPEGYRFMFGLIIAPAADATVTLAIGTVAAPARYRAAAVVNTTLPVLFGLAAAVDDPAPVSPGVEIVRVSAAAAASTTAGYVILRFYAKP